jgi:hyperpolarization activated cyclic nucleotide-gated potassium channel 1
VSVFVSVAVIAHIIGCLWYFMAKLEGFPPDSWVFKNGYMNESDDFKYITALYWTYTTVSTVGYGDISPTTELEMVMGIFLMLFGV